MESRAEREVFDKHWVKRINAKWYEKRYMKSPFTIDRLKTLKMFLRSCGDRYILDAGCGGVEPLIISNNENAVGLDISKTALLNLKANSFEGELVLASAMELPFKDRTFSRAVCSEVIEHLPTDCDVFRCVAELNRVAKQYLITTPNCRFGFKRKDPTHRRFFSIARLKNFLPPSAICWTIAEGETIFPYFLSRGHTKFPSTLDDRKTRSIFIYRFLIWLDRRLCRTKIGKKVIAFKRRAIGGAYIVAFGRRNLK